MTKAGASQGNQSRQYLFEQQSRSGHRSDSDIQHDLTVFKSRLEIADNASQVAENGELGELLYHFVKWHQANINWYVARITRERQLRNGFIGLSILLLAAIPLAVLFIGQFMTGTGTSGAGAGSAPVTVTAQLTAVLTSIIAVHRTLTSWFEKRRVVSHFHQASSTLKEAVWSFESKWKGRWSELLENFKTDLQTAIAAARRTVDKEEKAYFATQMELPEMDLAAALKSARTHAVDIVAAHESPELAARRRRESKSDEIRVLEAEIEARAAQIKRKTDTRAGVKDATRLAAIDADIERLETQIEDKWISLAIKRAELEAI